MVKKRLIFTLLYNEGKYCLSRNFSLQSVGDLAWIIENYDFDRIANAIDELVVLNVSRNPLIDEDFQESVRKLSRFCFIPICIGGGIRSVEDAYLALDIGADKIAVNTLLYTDIKAVEKIVENFGSQFVIGSADFKTIDGIPTVFYSNGQKSTGSDLFKCAKRYEEAGVGELYVTSIDRDGTGRGFELNTLKELAGSTSVPIIAAGGAGRPIHFAEAFSIDGVTGAATANLFNFMGGGLLDAREYLLDLGIKLARWKVNSGLEAKL